jgi:methylated-DNA-[protein]-cysteine S-methyltransferase
VAFLRSAARLGGGVITRYRFMDSPVGNIMLVGREGDRVLEVSGVYLVGQRYEPDIGADWVLTVGAFEELEERLTAYFAGEQVNFGAEFSLQGTDFQRQVWRALSDIPYGTTISYGTLADRVADRTRTRAVGAAVGRNPLSIVIPCHRVVGADGSLTGYAGGLERKRWLLDHEATVSGTMLRL